MANMQQSYLLPARPYIPPKPPLAKVVIHKPEGSVPHRSLSPAQNPAIATFCDIIAEIITSSINEQNRESGAKLPI